MPTPYNLDVHNDCADCNVHAERTFCNMGPETMKELDSIKFTGIYPKGSLLFVEGEQPRGVFILCSGRAKLTTSSSEGKTLIVKIAEVGEVLGASATILGKPYEVSAETIEPSQLNFIKREDFVRFLQSHVEVCMHTAQQLSEKYQSAQREIRSLGLSQTTSEKLARLLLDWCTKGGEPTPKGHPPDRPPHARRGRADDRHDPRNRHPHLQRLQETPDHRSQRLERLHPGKGKLEAMIGGT